MTDIPASKVCCTCKEDQLLNEFNKSKSTKDGLEPRCKSCRRQARERNAEKIKARSRAYYLANREEALARQKRYYEENRDYIRRYQEEWYRNNKDRVSEYGKRWYSKFREDVKNRSKEYYHQNRDERVAYRRRYVEENYEAARQSDRASWYRNKESRMATIRRRYREDPKFRLRIRMKNMLSNAVRLYGLSKDRTLKDLGYTPAQLKKRIEVQFKPGMSWDNYGEWHIDHKIPVARFVERGETRQWVIHALSNLQPMWAEDNHRKGARWVG